MNVVIAIDSFKGSLTSLEAGESAARGIKKVYPNATTIIRPLADGGEGTAYALANGCGGLMLPSPDLLGNRLSASTALSMRLTLQSLRWQVLPASLLSHRRREIH